MNKQLFFRYYKYPNHMQHIPTEYIQSTIFLKATPWKNLGLKINIILLLIEKTM